MLEQIGNIIISLECEGQKTTEQDIYEVSSLSREQVNAGLDTLMNEGYIGIASDGQYFVYDF